MKEINFVLDEDHGDVAALVLDLPLPGLDGLERRPVRRREHDDASLTHNNEKLVTQSLLYRDYFMAIFLLR